MGRDKGLLRVPGGSTFLSRLVWSLREGGCTEVVAVVGAAEDAFRAAVEREGVPVRLVRNPDPSRGQLSSLHEALDNLAPRVPRAIVMAPVNIPLVAPATVRAVIDAWEHGGAPVVRPSQRGRHGHPVLFDARVLLGSIQRRQPVRRRACRGPGTRRRVARRGGRRPGRVRGHRHSGGLSAGVRARSQRTLKATVDGVGPDQSAGRRRPSRRLVRLGRLDATPSVPGSRAPCPRPSWPWRPACGSRTSARRTSW